MKIIKKIIGAVSIFNDISEILELTQELQRTREMTLYLQEQLNNNELPKSFDDYIHQSRIMGEILKFAAKIAKTDCTILIRGGESGVGKEVMADAIHYGSKRANKPFIKVNCASIPETLLESEFLDMKMALLQELKKPVK